MSSGSAEDIRKHLGLYWVIFGALLVLTALTVGVSYFHLPIHYAVILALFIAGIKGSLVAGWFMHLKGERKIIWWVLYLTVFMFFVCLLLPTLTDADSSIIGPMWSKSPAAEQPVEVHH